jgi:hypothetical protein
MSEALKVTVANRGVYEKYPREHPDVLTAFRVAATVTVVVLSLLGCGPDLVGLPPAGGAALEVVADGLDAPLVVTFAPGDERRLFVVEKPGRIRIVLDGVLTAAPFLDITSITSDDGEQGLLGLAFHPAYASNGTFFVNHTDVAGDTRVVRYGVSGSPDEADVASASLVIEVPQPFANHNGGHLAFGPDGMLYVALGDGGSAGDPHGHGQNRTTLLGSVLRIDVDSGEGYAIPSDNPFADGDGAPEIWAYGLRNPWRFSFDRGTGDLYIGDVGQQDIEEISVLPAASPGGANLGWNVLEGSRCYLNDACDSAEMLLPVYEYTHDDGCSVTGGYVYRGGAVPVMEGRYFFGDFCRGWIRSFRLVGGAAVGVHDHTADFGSVPSLASFGEDAGGELYVVSLAGTVYRMVAPE